MRLSVAVALALSAPVLAGPPGLPTPAPPGPPGIRVQNPRLSVPPRYASRKNDVKKIFTDSYDAYRKYAWGHDDLSPVSKGFNDGRNGWGATIVDALPTIYLMGLEAEFLEAVNYTAHIDFSRSKTSESVSVFETTIRYLGGLLSAYELSGKKHPELLAKATEVADKMAYAWVGENPIPFGFIDFATNTPEQRSSNIAEAGTLSLEGYILSQHSGNATYGDKAVKALAHIANLPAPLPGLAAQGIDPKTGNFVGGYVSWGGGSDSYFEYLLKYARLSNTKDNIYMDTWKTAVDSSIKHLLRKSTVGNHVYLGDYDDAGRVRHISSHLACFHAGNWMLGGKLLKNQTIIDIALDLNEACWNTYSSTQTGIGPEAFAFESSEGNFTGRSPPTAAQAAFYKEHGFYITDAFYILRPEVLESNFHAWRITGKSKYLDRAGDAIDSFMKYLPSTVGYASLNDVNDASRGQMDDTQSFWFAEVLKYLWLTFDDPKTISLDDYVFNTECQPFRAPASLPSYDSGSFIPSKPFKIQTGDLPEVSPFMKKIVAQKQ